LKYILLLFIGYLPKMNKKVIYAYQYLSNTETRKKCELCVVALCEVDKTIMFCFPVLFKGTTVKGKVGEKL